MSRIKRKTNEVVAEGKVSRETWTPKLGSAPLRVYRWWLKETGKYIYQENFCHFWRVVLIWAPLLRVRQMTRLDKVSLPRISSSSFDKLMIAFPVGMLLAMMTAWTFKLWPDHGWWSILIAPGLLVVSIGLVAVAVVVLVFVGIGMEKPVEAIKSYRLARLVRRSPHAIPSQSVAKRALAGARSAGRSTGEIVVLAGQVVRVKKWKVCPLVEIPPEG